MGVPVYTPVGWVDDTTDLSSTNFQHMEQGILDAIAGLASSKGGFKVGLAGAITVAATPTLIPYSDKVSFGGHDNDTWYDSTNHRYNPQRAGEYTFFGAWRIAGTPASGNGVWVSLYKNGALLLQLSPSLSLAGTANPGGPFASPPVQMNGTTDYVDIRMNMNSSSFALSVDASTNFFGGHFTGA